MRDSDALHPYRAAQARSQVTNPYQDVPQTSASPPTAPSPGNATAPGPSPVPSPQRAALAAATNPFSNDRRFVRPGPRSQYHVPNVATPAPSPAAPASVEQGAASAWNTDGYARPGYTASAPGGVLAGWDATKWADPTHQTPKYVVGRILSQYGASPQALQQALAEIQRAYPGATWNGKDLITLPGGGAIDVGGSFSTNDPSQMRWQWMPHDQQASGGVATPSAAALSSVLGNPFLANAPSTYAGVGGQQSLLTQLLAQYLGY